MYTNDPYEFLRRRVWQIHVYTSYMEGENSSSHGSLTSVATYLLIVLAMSPRFETFEKSPLRQHVARPPYPDKAIHTLKSPCMLSLLSAYLDDHVCGRPVGVFTMFKRVESTRVRNGEVLHYNT